MSDKRPAAIDILRDISTIISNSGDVELIRHFEEMKTAIVKYRIKPLNELPLQTIERIRQAKYEYGQSLINMKRRLLANKPIYKDRLNSLLTSISARLAEFSAPVSMSGPAAPAAAAPAAAATATAGLYFQSEDERTQYLNDNIADVGVRDIISQGFTTANLTYYGSAIDTIRTAVGITDEVKRNLAQNIIVSNYVTHIRYVTDDIIRNTPDIDDKIRKFATLLRALKVYTEDDIIQILDAINNSGNITTDETINTTYISKPTVNPQANDQIYLLFQTLRSTRSPQPGTGAVAPLTITAVTPGGTGRRMGAGGPPTATGLTAAAVGGTGRRMGAGGGSSAGSASAAAAAVPMPLAPVPTTCVPSPEQYSAVVAAATAMGRLVQAMDAARGGKKSGIMQRMNPFSRQGGGARKSRKHSGLRNRKTQRRK